MKEMEEKYMRNDERVAETVSCRILREGALIKAQTYFLHASSAAFFVMSSVMHFSLSPHMKRDCG